MAVRVSQAVLTALWQKPTASPTTPDAGTVAVTQAVLTALMSPSDDVDTPGAGGSSPATHTYGYAV